jgi:hypothetical protein
MIPTRWPLNALPIWMRWPWKLIAQIRATTRIWASSAYASPSSVSG